ncbi:MAG: glycosyltransferase family 2 protein [candidate division KSB1 bacterium]|nr:glycosyltransferase family 2 protein [candidate division KSB1 bacterium]MDZ7273775.1 glycosyltransferase family 2 protein [candidate division KSB1 bacterium]MDZ7285931.1 glycosyltransferase family 2 protein [candidate division KSB1 bacterium]MDZ7298963.1 glycosyltransferase family 2 protein [candidate division KSB1 bacterium]MDZ7308598.1 glycosyltransferase family 2 protein [candidate division KSB1 bacterium]
MPPDLSIIIVTHNSANDIDKCLRSLQQYCTGVRSEIIVFDNASTDATCEVIASRFAHVRLIRHAENVGFARANNLAVSQAHGRHLLFLNPDTWVDADLATALVRFLDSHEQAGGCAPRVLNPDGSLQRGSVRAFPTLTTLLYDQLGLSRLWPRSPRFGHYLMTWWDHQQQREVEQPMGACLAVRREAFTAVAGFDEGYFMYFEDVELCRALHNTGWKIFFLPEARVFHVGGQSTSPVAVSNFPQFYRSMYRYFRRHHGRTATLVAKVLVTMGEIGKLFTLLVLLATERLPARPTYWRSRRQQFLSHGRVLLQHWGY